MFRPSSTISPPAGERCGSWRNAGRLARLYTRSLDDFHGHDRLIDAVAVQSRTAKTVTWVADSGETVRTRGYRLTNSSWGSLFCAYW